jgi:hypothetical protein
VGAQLGAGLEGVGSGRYAAVVQDRLYLYDGEAPPALVPLPDGNVRIVDASDGSLLVSTHLANVVVSTRPARATTLGAGVVALASSDGFWIVQPDGRVATDHGNRAFRVPAGMRLAGAVDEAFVGLQADSSWVLWTGTQTRPIAPAGYRLLAVSGRRVAFEHGCSSAGCRVDIADVRGGPPVETSFPHIPDFAAFSPDGSRLAMTSRLADLSLVDTRTGATIVSAQLGGPLTEQTMSRRFTWTADGRSLLVFDGGALDVVRAADGETVSRVVVDTALEQISALP